MVSCSFLVPCRFSHTWTWVSRVTLYELWKLLVAWDRWQLVLVLTLKKKNFHVNHGQDCDSNHGGVFVLMCCADAGIIRFQRHHTANWKWGQCYVWHWWWTSWRPLFLYTLSCSKHLLFFFRPSFTVSGLCLTACLLPPYCVMELFLWNGLSVFYCFHALYVLWGTLPPEV